MSAPGVVMYHKQFLLLLLMEINLKVIHGSQELVGSNHLEVGSIKPVLIYTCLSPDLAAVDIIRIKVLYSMYV